MMKFALFLVCALVAVQGLQARSVEPEDRDISDTIDKIKEVIEKINQVIKDIMTQIPAIIENIEKQIKDIIAVIPGIINGIKEAIQEIIHTVGDASRKCVNKYRPMIDNLIKFTKNGMQECVDQAESQTGALKEQIQILLKKAAAFRDDVEARVAKCIDDNKNNPFGLIKCLKEQVEPISEEFAALQQEVVKTINVAKETIATAGPELAECVAEVRKETTIKTREIIYVIKDCIINCTS